MQLNEEDICNERDVDNSQKTSTTKFQYHTITGVKSLDKKLLDP